MSDPRDPDRGRRSAWSDGHPDELVSAHVDGELDGDVAADVARHLEECPPCQELAAEVEAARRWLHDAPRVDASVVVEPFLARHRRLVRNGSVFVVAATVAAVGLALTASVLRPAIVPPIDTMVAVHVAADPESMAGMRPVDAVGTPYAAPPAMLGNRSSLSRQALYAGAGVTVVVYGDGIDRAAVTVFEQHGRLDWGALPAGERISVGSREAWTNDGSPTVVVTEVGHLVVTVVAEDRGAAVTAIDGLPARRRGSTFHRVHDACQRVTEVFAIAGG